MLKVGLTGGIACGKTHVARRLAGRGLHVLDLDAVAHEMTAPGGAAYDEVVRAFGRGILDAAGAVDRRALGARVFADPEALARLNAIVHPKVRAEEARRARALAGKAEVLVTEAALLVESGLHLRFDRLVVVDCRPEQQVERLAGREGMTAEAARARIAAQMPVDQKRGFAHFVVDGSLPFAETDRMADDLADTLWSLAATPTRPWAVPVERALGALAHGPARGPRGLTPALVLRQIVDTGAPEMERLALRLEPPATSPWYRAAAAAAEDPRPETLAVPVALWSLARRGDDPDHAAAAAASLARLTHRDPSVIADACLFALALAHVGAAGGLAGLPSRWAGWSRLAARWAGGPTTGRIDRAATLAGDAQALRSGSQRDGASAEHALAGALAGMASGLAGRPAPEDWVRAVEGLREASGPT
jgi:dephospho-CoA kinase